MPEQGLESYPSPRGRAVVALTHPPEYRLHKYWTRKPANVLADYLTRLMESESRVVDPFAGSGVLLREAAALGHNVIGFDVNPIAVTLSRVTLDPPEVGDFEVAARSLIAAVEGPSDAAFLTASGERVRYVVHSGVTVCPACSEDVVVERAVRRGRSYSCPACGAMIRFNLRSITRTEVVEVVLASGAVVHEPDELRRQSRLSSQPAAPTSSDPYVQRLVVNRRTLTHDGLTTADYFTARNLSLLAAGFAHADGVPDERLRNALLLMLTGAVAQCSRLIPYRQGMTGGGPAWSVPGFWVPPVHLESNPLSHLTARARKMTSGIKALTIPRLADRTSIEQCRAEEGLRRLASEGQEADLIFLDPPYGDSVPFLEFSALWNAFLRQTPRLEDDMSVSDRLDQPMTWASYELRLTEVLGLCDRVLASEGKLLVTFNNNDLRAWKALLGALQASGFAASEVTYQAPAVVPAKAQFSPTGSYVGDLFVVADRRGRHPVDPDDVRPHVMAALSRCASARDGLVAPNLARRTSLATWLLRNGRAEDITRVD